MLVIPAIDLRGGRCVRLRQGAYDRETVFAEDPVAVARRWAAAGARRLHLVDLDGAREGGLANREVIDATLQAVSVPVQVGGGIRTPAAAAYYLTRGAARIVLGTLPFREPETAREICRQYPGQVLGALDLRGGAVAVQGWTQSAAGGALEGARTLEALGVAGLIVTDVERDGMLGGPNVEQVGRIVAAVRVPVIAAGGIATLAHLRELAALPLEGVIVGRAIYDGTLDLIEAIRATQEGA
ncbi:MAG: 1-(5-phosphoribosyl)-5-[(5-phosphoribosylamino)methylideneamino]imidazole-4-carboxamide isomerase [Deltaproteobacteria bacterium]|nr:1-(5-phosphoribosyl)-5-[(5-phosphoribosylamino)methylideneamino]imidazole-4-carboxamide isomerase [Deltaproteobacteria bacterium]